MPANHCRLCGERGEPYSWTAKLLQWVVAMQVMRRAA